MNCILWCFTWHNHMEEFMINITCTTIVVHVILYYYLQQIWLMGLNGALFYELWCVFISLIPVLFTYLLLYHHYGPSVCNKSNWIYINNITNICILFAMSNNHEQIANLYEHSFNSVFMWIFSHIMTTIYWIAICFVGERITD